METKSNRNIFIALVIIAIAIIVGVVIYTQSSGTSSTNSMPMNSMSPEPMSSNSPMSQEPMMSPSPAMPAATSPAPAQTNSVKSFTITASNYSFAPTQISVKKGDTVKITLINSNGFHDFHIDAFNVAAPALNAGSQETVTFVASKAGTFQYYCSFHKAMGMVGTLTVTE